VGGQRCWQWRGAAILLGVTAAVGTGVIGGESVHAQPAPPFTVAPTSLDIGPTQAFHRSAPSNLVVTNTGATPLTFSVRKPFGEDPFEVTGCTAPVPAGQSCTAQVVATPPGPTDTFDTIVVVEAAGAVIDVPLTLRTTPFAQDPPTPDPLDFGAVRNGQSSAKTLLLRNWWERTTSITTAAFPAGSRYAITRSTCGPGVMADECEFDITYTPGFHVGADDDVLTLTGPWGAGGAAATEVFDMRATGVASPIISFEPASLKFASQQVGTSSAPLDLLVTNVGNAPLALQAAVSGGGEQVEFPLSGCDGVTIPAGQSCTLKVVWAPIYTGITPRQGVIFLADANGAAVTVQAPLSTDRLLPFDFEPRTVAFPTTPAGRVSAPLTIRAVNYNTADTPVEGFRLASGDFAVTSFNCSPTVGDFCDITVVFQPTKAGPLAADVVVFGPFYGPPAQEVFKVSGTGAAPGPLDDVASVRAGATVTLDPRSNDRDPGGATLTMPTIVTPPSVGTATVGADGIVTYVAPRRVASGTVVSIVYSVCDLQGACSTATIRITITALGGLLPATGREVPLLLALAVAFVLAGLGARRIAQGARVGRR
jgi:hypothetical protein